jgi:outer membrane receptor protein involved in Fe transport
VPDLSVTLGYHVIELSGMPAHRGGGAILDGCYLDGRQEDCALVHRDASGLVVRVDDPLWNAASTRTAGLDVSARYHLATGGLGQLTFLVDGTFLQYHRLTPPDGFTISGKGRYDLGVLPAFKGHGTIGWQLAGFGAGVTGRYVGSYVECASTVCSFDDSPRRAVSAWLSADLVLSYALRSAAGRTALAVGVQNVGDTQPPRVFTAHAYSADPSYGYAGRFFYGRVTQAF